MSGGSIVSWSDTPAARIVTVQVSLAARVWAMSITYEVGPPVTEAVCRPEVLHAIVYQTMTFTGSLKLTVMFESTGTPVAPSAGSVDCTVGAASEADAVTEMSSTPTHSSLPVAFAVMIRSCTTGWFATAAGSETFTGVTSVARLGPVVASATNAAGTFVKLPLVADAVLQRDGLHRVVERPVDVAQVVGDLDVREAGRVQVERAGTAHRPCRSPGARPRGRRSRRTRRRRRW